MSRHLANGGGMIGKGASSRIRWYGCASLGIILAIGTSGCGRIGLNDPLAASAPAQTAYEPLPAAPAAPVTSSALPPPPPVTAPTVTTGTPVDPMQPGQPPASGPGTAVAAVPSTAVKPAEPVAAPSSGGPAIDRGKLTGVWRVAAGSETCQLGFTLTSWSGGYRAWTRGCNSSDLQHIAAWEVVGKQIALKGADGSVIAMLSSAGQDKYSGTTSSKQAIVVTQ